MRRAIDHATGDLFAVPQPASPVSGGLDVGLVLRHLLSDLLKATPQSRFEVAARMAELTGHDISKHQLDAWTAESREGWRFPLEYLPAFEAALQTYTLSQWIAKLRGATLLVGPESLLAELGKIERAKQELAAREKALKKLISKRNS